MRQGYSRNYFFPERLPELPVYLNWSLLAMNLSQARENMIEQQIRPWDVLDPRVLTTLNDVPRDKFVDPDKRELAYTDFQLPIGHGQCMLNPNIDGRILQALRLNNTDKVLEIGTGSGYLTACLANLAGQITTLEIIPQLADQAQTRLSAMGIGNITTHTQDAAESWDAADAYDAIALTGAVYAVPEFYQQKMALGGRLFAVVGSLQQPTMEAILLTRVTQNEWTRDSLFETRIPELVNFDQPKQPFRF